MPAGRLTKLSQSVTSDGRYVSYSNRPIFSVGSCVVSLVLSTSVASLVPFFSTDIKFHRRSPCAICGASCTQHVGRTVPGSGRNLYITNRTRPERKLVYQGNDDCSKIVPIKRWVREELLVQLQAVVGRLLQSLIARRSSRVRRRSSNAASHV